MPSGGARPGAGRPPAENSIRKDRRAKAAARSGIPATDDGDWLSLPREGRSGNAPAWPLWKPDRPDATSRRELALWRRLWKTPQAIGWDKVGVDHDHIALYVRYRVEAEMPGALIGVRLHVRQYADSLGLTAPGLRALHWRIGQPAKAHVGEPVAVVDPHRPAPGRSARERKFQLVASGDL